MKPGSPRWLFFSQLGERLKCNARQQQQQRQQQQKLRRTSKRDACSDYKMYNFSCCKNIVQK
jgi:hypothetical protein